MHVSSIEQVDLASQISVAVARKSLDAVEQRGAALVDLIRSAGETGTSGRGAISPRAAGTETGRRLDVTA